MRRAERWCAAGSAVVAVVGAAGLLAATTGFSGYVSEAGAPGAPHQALYRASTFCVAASLALLAVATRSRLVLAAAPLALAAPFAAVSGAVRCSPGCPLPPYETPTAGDLVHAGASIAALGLCALAILAYAFRSPDRLPARVGRVAAVVAVPLLGLAGIALFTAGRGLLTGVLERAALVAMCAWLAVAAGLHAGGADGAPDR